MGNYRNFTLTTYFVAHATAHVTEAQLEGKKRMSAADLMNGRSLEMNERLG